MKRLLLCAATVSTLAAQAQHRYQVTASQGLGYDRNIFKSPPSLQTGDLRQNANALYQNGPFSQTRLTGKIAGYAGQYGDFRLTGKAQVEQFPTVANANAHRFEGTARYRYHLTQTVHVGVSGNLGHVSQLGINVVTDDRVLRFTYFKAALAPEVHLKLNRQHTLTLALGRTLRNYQRLPSGNDLSFRGWEFTAKSKHKLNKRESLTGKLALSRRNHYNWLATIEQAEVAQEGEAADPEEIAEAGSEAGAYLMDYVQVKGGYQRKVSKQLTYKAFAQLEAREDRGTGQWTYQGVRIGGSVRKQFDRLTVETKARLGFRRYPNREAFRSEADSSRVLSFIYVEAALLSSYALNKRWALFGELSLSNRYSNSILATERARRSFYTTTALVGVRWKLKGKTNQR